MKGSQVYFGIQIDPEYIDGKDKDHDDPNIYEFYIYDLPFIPRVGELVGCDFFRGLATEQEMQILENFEFIVEEVIHFNRFDDIQYVRLWLKVYEED